MVLLDVQDGKQHIRQLEDPHEGVAIEGAIHLLLATAVNVLAATTDEGQSRPQLRWLKRKDAIAGSSVTKKRLFESRTWTNLQGVMVARWPQANFLTPPWQDCLQSGAK
jgi:hypothetical protein